VSCLRSTAFSCRSTSNSASLAARRCNSTARTDSSFRVTRYTGETVTRTRFQEALMARQTHSEQQRRIPNGTRCRRDPAVGLHRVRQASSDFQHRGQDWYCSVCGQETSECAVCGVAPDVEFPTTGR
jgi:hypothetical protein